MLKVKKNQYTYKVLGTDKKDVIFILYCRQLYLRVYALYLMYIFFNMVKVNEVSDFVDQRVTFLYKNKSKMYSNKLI